MELGECFIYDQTKDFYISFPYLSCSDSSTLPNFDTTIGEIYQKRDNRLVKIRNEVISYSDYSDYISYIYDHNKISLTDINFIYIIAAIFSISLFLIIYRWFFRLRA